MLRTTLRIALTAIALTIAALPALSAQAALPPNDPDAGWIVDGQVNALARDGQTLYVGGEFEFLNRRTGGGFRADPGRRHGARPAVRRRRHLGDPRTAPGGFYAGGHFRTIDGEPYERLAHVLADGTIDTAFRPPPMNDTVGALAIAGDKLIIGGQFSSVDNQPRRGIAALDRATGAPRHELPAHAHRQQPVRLRPGRHRRRRDGVRGRQLRVRRRHRRRRRVRRRRG